MTISLRPLMLTKLSKISCSIGRSCHEKDNKIFYVSKTFQDKMRYLKIVLMSIKIYKNYKSESFKYHLLVWSSAFHSIFNCFLISTKFDIPDFTFYTQVRIMSHRYKQTSFFQLLTAFS